MFFWTSRFLSTDIFLIKIISCCQNEHKVLERIVCRAMSLMIMIWRKMPFCFEYIYEGRHLCLPDPPWTSLLPRGTGTSWIIIFNWKFISSKLKFSSKNSSWLSWIFHWKWCFNWSLYLVVTDPGKPLLLSNKRNALFRNFEMLDSIFQIISFLIMFGLKTLNKKY